MNKLFLIRNPELFQGEKYLNKNNNYFEGWYFKNINGKEGISFIPGISIDKKVKKAFIQVITNNSSYFVNYDIKDFKYSFNPFCINVGHNSFSKEGIHIDIKDNSQKLNIYGNIKYTNSQNIAKNLLTPNIMGPFSYVPFMECNHSILSMKNKIWGSINMNNKIMRFNNDVGYIEKDWGSSFPKSYIWCQGNNFDKSNASFMLSIADIPLKLFDFRGIISVLIVDEKEYRFTTYNNAKIVEYEVDNNFLNITLRKGEYSLNIKSKYNKGYKLSAPVKGRMEKDIFESISSLISVTLKKNNEMMFSDTSTNCGLEIVQG